MILKSLPVLAAASKCRHCRSELTLTLVDLGLSPVANDYVDPENSGKAEPFYPLKALVCRHVYRETELFGCKRQQDVDNNNHRDKGNGKYHGHGAILQAFAQFELTHSAPLILNCNVSFQERGM